MKVFHFNDDWFAADAIARIHKFTHPSADLPFRIGVTYKHNHNGIIYDYKEEKLRNHEFDILIEAWRWACKED